MLLKGCGTAMFGEVELKRLCKVCSFRFDVEKCKEFRKEYGIRRLIVSINDETRIKIKPDEFEIQVEWLD